MNRREFGNTALFDYIKRRLLIKTVRDGVHRAIFGGVAFALTGNDMSFDVPMKEWDTNAIAKDLAAAQQAEINGFEDTRY